MGRRLSRGGLWSAALGLVALAAALGRMTTLVRPSLDGAPWPATLTGAFLLGAAIAVVGWLVRLRLPGTIAFGLVTIAVVMGRVTAPDTMLAGLVPTRATWDAVAAALTVGLEYLRYGTAPIFPHQELLLLLLPVFIAIGAAWAWLTAGGRGAAAAAVPAGLYLAVSIADQGATPGWWLVAAVAWVGLLLVVSGWEGTVSAPRLLGRPGRAGAIAAGVVVVVLGLVATDIGAGAVPSSGAVPWRDGDTFGPGSGTSLNLFASTTQTNLVSRSDDVMFRAAVVGAPADELYWSLITLDSYDGRNWAPSWDDTRALGDGVVFERRDLRYLGPTSTVSATVEIGDLRQGLLPHLYSVRDVQGDAPLIRNGVRVRDDGALLVDGRTRDGLRYQLTSQVPDRDLGVAALGADGALSPLFEGARDAGVFTPAGAGTGRAGEPADLDRFLELPDDLDPGIEALARRVSEGATTPLEQMIFLESWFRVPDLFIYSAEIDPGHAADDLADWLLDPETPNHRVGYCEQFATALGVMGRSLGIPTRLVLGFTPGRFNQFGEVEVLGRNAHAWVEAWIEGVGWVRFDPTPRSEGDNPAATSDLGFNLAAFVPEEVDNPLADLNPGGGPVLVDPERFADFADPGPTPEIALDGEADADSGTPFAVPARVWWLVALAGVFVAIPLAKWVRRHRRLARARDGDVTAAWEEIVDRLRDLDRPISTAMTPDEIVAATGPELAPLAAAHARSTWGDRPPGPAETERALTALGSTEMQLRRTTPRMRRVMAAWRPRSLRRP